LISSTLITLLTSAPTKQQQHQKELGSGSGRARSQRHASASYPRSESGQADSLYAVLSERSHSSHVHSSRHLPSVVNDLDPTALAHHLTLLESGFYMCIKRKQILEWHKTSGLIDESNANITPLATMIYQVCNTVITGIHICVLINQSMMVVMHVKLLAPSSQVSKPKPPVVKFPHLSGDIFQLTFAVYQIKHSTQDTAIFKAQQQHPIMKA
jgi:hypothetical protein